MQYNERRIEAVLVIRDQQLQAFVPVLEREFVIRLADHLIETFPEQAAPLGREAVEARAHAAFLRARGYGLRSKAHITSFADADFVLGAEFEKARGMEWALAALADPDLTPANKIYRLFRRSELRGIRIYHSLKERSASAGKP